LCKADFITDYLSERVFMSDPANNSFFSNDPVGEDLFQFNTGSEKASPPSPTVSPALAQGPLPIYQPGQEPQGSAVPSQQQPQTSAGYYDPNQSSVAIPKPYSQPQASYLQGSQDQIRGRSGKILLIFGIIAFIVGLAITAGTYAGASNGGTYFISWGPMTFGFISIVRGISRMVKGQ
jgi:hypothetical protein